MSHQKFSISSTNFYKNIFLSQIVIDSPFSMVKYRHKNGGNNMDIYLHFKDQAAEAITYYEKVFKTEPAKIMTFGDMPHDDEHPVDENMKDLVMNSNLKINDTNVMISDSPEGMAPPLIIGNNVALVFNAASVEEATEIFQLLAEKGVVLLPLEKTFWAELYGMIKDRYGVVWHINLY